MFGDLLGDMQEKQKAIKEKLSTITVEAEAGDGAIKVSANANKEILNISINREAIDLEDLEQLEDLLLVAVNRAMALAIEKEQSETQNLIKDMLPPGMGGFDDLFG